MSSEAEAGNKDEAIRLLLPDDVFSASPTSFRKADMASPAALGDAKGLSGRLCSTLQLKHIITTRSDRK